MVDEDTQPTRSVTTTSTDPQSAPDSPPVQASTLPTLTATPTEEKPAVDTLIREPLEGEDFNFVLPDADTQERIQKDLAALDLYPGKVNGKWGNLSVAGIQRAVKVPVTGSPNRETVEAILEATGHTRRTTARLDQKVWEDFAGVLETK